jgi:signal transduction histidine kinase
MAKFTVDTHLFRELGELLVGRDSTALVELIKNSYDADARVATVYGESLSVSDRGLIRVLDDGVGMGPKQFEEGFLRIASRTKEEGNRHSLRYGRRFTGAKGIGRLAAHKLSRLVEIDSIPWVASGNGQERAVRAKIDWDAVERKNTLDDLDDQAVRVSDYALNEDAKPGTTITLRRLRRRWTPTQLGRFLSEVHAFEPPQILVASLPRKTVAQPLLFDSPVLRDSRGNDPGFRVKLEGEFAFGDEYWQTLLSAVDWIIEIDAKQGQEMVRYRVAPTVATQRKYPQADKQNFKVEHPDPSRGPFFQARIFMRSGALQGPAAEREWARRTAGIRVYLEGFRILPYGEPKDDWLSLDADYALRGRSLKWLDEVDSTAQEFDKDEALVLVPNRQYFGAVFLTQSGASSLRLLVNREGFVPDVAFEHLVAIVRKGTDLFTRVYAAATKETRKERKQQRSYVRLRGEIVEKPSTPSGATVALKNTLTKATTLTAEAKQFVVSGNLQRANEKLNDALSEFNEATDISDDLISELPMFRILASIGTQMTAFVHEIRGLLGMAESIDEALARLRKNYQVPSPMKTELGRLHGALGDLRRNLERQASYLVDVVTPDARRRRSRQNLTDRFEASRKLIEHLAEKRSIVILNEIPRDLFSPPMFAAELTTIYANLLTNAVKAAGRDGRIRASATRRSDGSLRIVIENTGVRVDPAQGEKWFAPFESTTTETDPALGQGMGMGLPITRNMLEEYGADISFVEPSRGYATAIEIKFQE